MTSGITEPEALSVQWLEEGLLVHGVILAASGPPLATVHRVAGAALALLLAALGAAAAGWMWIAALLAAGGAGAAVVLGKLALEQSRAVPAAPVRLLVELGSERLSWTSLSGDRWSMRHDHEVALASVVDVAPEAVPEGASLRIGLGEGQSKSLPLYGLPAGDVRWVEERIVEAVTACR